MFGPAARRGGCSIGLSLLVMIVAACSGDVAADSTDLVTIATTADSASGTDVSSETYTVESGDAVSVIADRYCVTSAALADANDWADGVDHLIRPGDAIALPADACEPVVRTDAETAARPATTRPVGAATPTVAAAGPTTTVNQYIESYRFDGGVPVIPMLGDPELYDGGDTLCYDAYYGVMDFNRGLADVADLEADLRAIDVTPTADQLRYLQAWQEWKDRYLDGYQTVLDEISAADLNDAATIEPLLADPRYVEASDAAYVIVGPAESVYSSVVAGCS